MTTDPRTVIRDKVAEALRLNLNRQAWIDRNEPSKHRDWINEFQAADAAISAHLEALEQAARIESDEQHPRTATTGDTETDFKVAMFRAETEGKYEDAALAALGLAEMVSVRSPEGALYCAQRAQVYATLHHAQNVVWVAENRRERMP